MRWHTVSSDGALDLESARLISSEEEEEEDVFDDDAADDAVEDEGLLPAPLVERGPPAVVPRVPPRNDPPLVCGDDGPVSALHV